MCFQDEDLELEDYEDDEEKEEEEGGVERYFKSVYNLADNFDVRLIFIKFCVE